MGEIGLHANDSKFPNLAIMKIAAHHKIKGDEVEFFMHGIEYDKIYSSKVFTWTNEDILPEENTLLGGSGYRLSNTLPDEIEHICPDYSLYGINYSMGFLTRGCSRKCNFCFVPEKEGGIRKHADLEEFVRHKEVVFLDNNVLASDHGIQQLERIAELGLKVDFNQGLDARLIDDAIARRLSKIKWLEPLRLACDSKHQIKAVGKAVQLLRWHNTTPKRFFCYVLVDNVEESLEIVKYLKGIDVDPFAQPLRKPDGLSATLNQKAFARWVNHKAIFKSTTWESYKKGTKWN